MALRAPAGADAQKKTLIATEQDRPAVARFRRRWRAHQHRIDPDRLVFLDETWIRTDMTRVRGWCPRGTPLLTKVPHGRWRTLTFIAGLRRTEIVAPCVFDGPINGDLFTAWVEQSLTPTLKPRDVVVLDNLGSHKGQRAREAVRAAGAHLLFLPAYSPDLNPIEMVFAKLKTLFRKADRRTIEEAWREVGSLLDRFSPTECAAYLRHAGYACNNSLTDSSLTAAPIGDDVSKPLDPHPIALDQASSGSAHEAGMRTGLLTFANQSPRDAKQRFVEDVWRGRRLRAQSGVKTAVRASPGGQIRKQPS